MSKVAKKANKLVVSSNARQISNRFLRSPKKKDYQLLEDSANLLYLGSIECNNTNEHDDLI